MIFCFTATGNSLYAAKTIANANKDKIVLIADSCKLKQFTYTLSENESVGFVFPIYFWGLPTIVTDFIAHLQLNNYRDTFTYAVFTCGLDSGNANAMLKERLQERAYHLNSAFAVAMPDTYILMLNVISKEKQQKLFEKADEELASISQYIKNREQGIFNTKPGRFPKFKTYVFYPFYKNGRETKKFHATDDCIGCGLCADICPSESIVMTNETPKWDKKKCIHCLACIHRCPTAAIQYGRGTYKKGRYINPKAKF